MKPEYVDIEIELDEEQLEYIKDNNLNLNELVKEWIDELREKRNHL